MSDATISLIQAPNKEDLFVSELNILHRCLQCINPCQHAYSRRSHSGRKENAAQAYSKAAIWHGIPCPVTGADDHCCWWSHQMRSCLDCIPHITMSICKQLGAHIHTWPDSGGALGDMLCVQPQGLRRRHRRRHLGRLPCLRASRGQRLRHGPLLIVGRHRRTLRQRLWCRWRWWRPRLVSAGGVRRHSAHCWGRRHRSRLRRSWWRGGAVTGRWL